MVSDGPLVEIDRTTPFIADLCLDREILISVTFAPNRHLIETQTPFFMNLRREGAQQQIAWAEKFIAIAHQLLE